MDRNPLRRRIDRVQVWGALALFTMLLIGAPLLAIFTGRLVYDSAVSAARRQAASRHFYDGTVVAINPSGRTFFNASGESTTVTWLTGKNVGHHAAVWLPDPKIGDTVGIWVDSGGRITDAPATRQHAMGSATLAGLVTVFGLAFVVLVVADAARSLLDRRRMAAWDAEWVQTAPKWTGRR